jgi:hypothetical protein
LVAGGVAGELAVGVVSANKNAILRDKNRALVQLVNQKAANAVISGGDAKKSSMQAADASERATGSAGKAERSASSAFTLARGARTEADTFEKDIVSAKQSAADAESHLAEALQRAASAEAELYRLKTPRSIINSDGLIAALKSFNGTEYTLNVFMDDEAIRFTKVVAATLDAAGWIRKQSPGLVLGIPTVAITFDQGAAENVPACIDTGISIRAHAKESLAVLQSIPLKSLPTTVQAAVALESAIAPSISPPDNRNVMHGILDPKPSEGVPMTICVGKKP